MLLATDTLISFEALEVRKRFSIECTIGFCLVRSTFVGCIRAIGRNDEAILCMCQETSFFELRRGNILINYKVSRVNGVLINSLTHFLFSSFRIEFYIPLISSISIPLQNDRSVGCQLLDTFSRFAISEFVNFDIIEVRINHCFRFLCIINQFGRNTTQRNKFACSRVFLKGSHILFITIFLTYNGIQWYECRDVIRVSHDTDGYCSNIFRISRRCWSCHIEG